MLVFLGPGFPGGTGHRGGVVLFLFLPHGFFVEILGRYVEESAEGRAWRQRASAAAARLFGLSACGGSLNGVLILSALSALGEPDWAFFAVWLLVPAVTLVVMIRVIRWMFSSDGRTP